MEWGAAGVRGRKGGLDRHRRGTAGLPVRARGTLGGARVLGIRVRDSKDQRREIRQEGARGGAESEGARGHPPLEHLTLLLRKHPPGVLIVAMKSRPVARQFRAAAVKINRDQLGKIGFGWVAQRTIEEESQEDLSDPVPP